MSNGVDTAALVRARRILAAAKEIDAALDLARQADPLWSSADHVAALAVAAAWHVGENAFQETATVEQVTFALRLFDMQFVGSLTAFFPDRCAPGVDELAAELLDEVLTLDPNFASPFAAGNA